MKLTRETLREIIKEVITETDGHPQILKKNKEVTHNWATHVEWRSATGKVISHTLTEDGAIEFYTVKFENKVVPNIPASEITILEGKTHKH